MLIHVVPLYRPAEAFHLFSRYLNGTDLFFPDFGDVSNADIYYGLVSFSAKLGFFLHSPVTPISMFLEPENKQDLGFIVRALRHALDRAGIPIHFISILSVLDANNEANAKRLLSRSNTRQLVIDLRIEAVASFDMKEVAQIDSASEVSPMSPYNANHDDTLASAIISALGLSVQNGGIDTIDSLPNVEELDARHLTSVLERKHQNLVDDHLKLKALVMKETAIAVAAAAILSGGLDDFVGAALFAESTVNADITNDMKVADLSFDIFSEYTIIQYIKRPAFVEWDTHYSSVKFPDLTNAPSRTPILGDTTTPIFIFTESSWIVIILTIFGAGTIATILAFVIYKRSTPGIKYYRVDNSMANGEEGELEGDLEMTTPQSQEDTY